MLTRRELDQAQCSNPECDHSDHSGVFWLHARCHASAPLAAAYDRQTGTLKLVCYDCDGPVAEIAVA